MNSIKTFTCLAFPVLFFGFSMNGFAQTQKKFTGEYSIYSGGIGDPQKPIPNQNKIAIEVNGLMAKEIFDSIGPDIPDVCSANADLRIRKKDNGALSCYRGTKGEYRCHIGFDLKNGKSIGGVVC